MFAVQFTKTTNSMKYCFSLVMLLVLSIVSPLTSQMIFRNKLQYGNEWIVPGQKYYKFNIHKDGMYRLSYSDLVSAGIPLQEIEAKNIQIFKNGEEQAIRTSTEGILSASDYIQFYATRNRGELDAALLRPGIPLFNPEFSMFTDTAAYFLTWNKSVSGLRTNTLPNDNSNPLAVERSYFKKEVIFFNENPTKRATGTKRSLKLPDFDEGQGYGTFYDAERTINLTFDHPHSGGVDAEIKVRVMGEGSGDNSLHRINFFVDNQLISNIQFTGYKVKEQKISLPADQIKGSMVLKVLANGQPEDRMSISTIEYRYESLFKFDQKQIASLLIGPSLTRKTMLIEEFDGGSEMTLYDITNHYYIFSQRQPDGTYPVDLPPSDQEREILIMRPDQYAEGLRLTEVRMASYEAGDEDYMIVTTERLRTGTTDAVNDYIQYRSSPQGGGYKVKLVYYEDIENQFGFGVQKHNIAMRNFFQYSRTLWDKMHYVLLIGKGLEYQEYRLNPQTADWNLLPSYSEPASDYLLVSDSLRNPFYTIGRLPVLNLDELTGYLNKVREHEAFLNSSAYTIENREWLKKVVHLAGGDPTLYATLRAQLSGMENEIENNGFGADVTTFNKESSGPVEIINSENLSSLINNGVSIISFMGHSASFRLDFNLDNISDYRNKGRYHMFIAMGCYAGEMFVYNRSISEMHNLAADKGSVIYLSNTSAGLPNILYKFGNDLYSQLGGRYYGEPVGDAMREVYKDLIATNGLENIYQALSTSFNGDPAIRLNLNKEVDITPDGTTASIEENVVYADQSKFDFKVDLVNLGLSVNDSVRVLIRNEYPDQSTDTVFEGRVRIPSVRSKFSFTIPVDENRSIGANRLLLTVDSDHKINEGPQPVAELNNDLVTGNHQEGFNYYVIGNNARPIYPTDFAIINESQPSLVAHNNNTFAPKSNYYMELDTTAYFNSPLLRNKIINQTGGVISWKLEQSLMPDKVYYWRVRPDSSGSGILAWKTSSFIYIPGKEIGWNQSHYFQFAADDLKNIDIAEPDRDFKYKKGTVEFTALNGYIELPTYIRPRVYIKDSVLADYKYWEFRSDLSGIVIAHVDPLTERLVPNVSGSDFGSIGGASMAGSNYFLFSTATAQDRASILNFVKNIIPDQHYVVFQTLVQYNYGLNSSDWDKDGPDNLVSFLKSVGAKSVDEFLSKGDVPYTVVFGKNRNDYETKDKVGDRLTESQVRNDIIVQFKQGEVRSKIVGPASKFNRFLWDYHSFDPSSDKHSVQIYGIEGSGKETLLFGPLTDANIDLSSVDTKVYPQIRLVWASEDKLQRTPSQLNYWRIFYTGLPDVMHDPALGWKKNYDTLSQGGLLKMEFYASNISIYDMDSLLVSFKLFDSRNTMVDNETRYIPVKAFGSINFPYQIQTVRQSGAYRLVVELNPHQDQAEFITANNTAVVNYFVRKDRRKPKIRVSFDGVVINNGDIVSPKSQIVVNLHDENNSIPMDDPSLFTIRIETPDKTVINIDPALQSNVRFKPAVSGTIQNEASMIIDGDFQQNGIYTIFIKAKDANGNLVSETEDQLDYRIVRESSISNVFNYPNPFTSKTRFVYTLTGEKSPSFFKIQILTVSGKIVRELTQNELGPLTIGTHMTEFEYDGTDDFGDKLANGVYLYRAIFKDESGHEIKKFDTSTDQFFVRNFGKMVILR